MPLLFPRPDYLPSVPPPLDVEDLRSCTGLPVVDGVLTSPPSLIDARDAVAGPFVFGPPSHGHVFFSDPEHVHAVLVKQARSFVKGEGELALSASAGWGLLTDEGQSHREHQRALGPGFRQEAMEKYLVGAWNNAAQSIAALNSDEGLGLVEWSRRYSQASGESLLLPSSAPAPDFGFGEKLFSLNPLTVMPLDASLTESLPLSDVKRYFSERDWILAYVQGLLDQRVQSNSDADVGLWDLLMETDAKSSSTLAQAVLFLGAATETTGSLISWMLIALSQHPKYWSMLSAEARGIHPESTDYRKIAALPLLQAVIAETLRLYSPTWLLPRIAIAPVEIAGVELHTGTRVWISPWVSHRRNGVFEQPERFWPERWFEEPTALPQGAYFPFGLGNRICIGERFAKMNAAILVLSVLRSGHRLTLSEASDALGSANVITNPKASIRVFLESK